MDGGTPVQLRNLINKRNVIKDPSDMKACKDFFSLVEEAYIVSAALTIFEMQNVEDTPSTTFFPEGSLELDSLQRLTTLLTAVRKVTDRFVDLSYGEKGTDTHS